MNVKLLLILALSLWNISAATISVLIVDGQNNHDFRATTPHLKKLLEETGLFTVEILSSPGKGGDMTQFKPDFNRYRAIVSNYNGEPWTQETQNALIRSEERRVGKECRG